MKYVDFLAAWYDQVMVQGNVEMIDQFFDSGAEAEGLITNMSIAKNDFKEFVTALLSMVEVKSVSIDRSFETPEWLAAVVTVHAENRTNMEEVKASGMVMVRIENGKIVEAFNQFDYISCFEQLGYLPQDTLATCLTGDSVF
ncbi:nuclear transport factor 2 family protein [Pseudaestuariivita rosea]|uniref:nuclear transport factor 2 family protein n=1 Tax=Pseudaestuariivita rosea TaxID=2763263 RepID=UPI001ABB92BA|nr:nuclear transport factor 2 family protein [Pseudaestuariivita rosea]